MHSQAFSRKLCYIRSDVVSQILHRSHAVQEPMQDKKRCNTCFKSVRLFTVQNWLFFSNTSYVCDIALQDSLLVQWVTPDPRLTLCTGAIPGQNCMFLEDEASWHFKEILLRIKNKNHLYLLAQIFFWKYFMILFVCKKKQKKNLSKLFHYCSRVAARLIKTSFAYSLIICSSLLLALFHLPLAKS